jgi:phenylalanyl-tRNA synthetase alpha chain
MDNLIDSQTVCNVPDKIWRLMNVNLHNQKNHPLEIIKQKIYNYPYFQKFQKFDDLAKQVSIENNFDKLLIPQNHPSRTRSDTYYIDEKTVLRTQTSAHQTELLEKGITQFLVTGDVYRKDEINKTHFPVFHQMEGLCITDDTENPIEKLHETLSGLMIYLFPDCKYRVKNDYFPFTDPSFEYEVKYKEGSDEDEKNWLEVLGCGIVQPDILKNCGYAGKQAWAFGLGIDRLAMNLFGIPDIRLFWSQDIKFLSQFENGEIVKFQQYSSLDPIQKDISFYIPTEYLDENKNDITKSIWKRENDFFDFIRSNDKDNVIQEIYMFDTFFHPKQKMLSRTYRITYLPCDTIISNPAIFTSYTNELHNTYYKNINQHVGVIYR